MPKFKVTYEPETGLGEEIVEADQMGEGPHFVIFARSVGEAMQPVLRIKATKVQRIELEG